MGPIPFFAPLPAFLNRRLVFFFFLFDDFFHRFFTEDHFFRIARRFLRLEQ